MQYLRLNPILEDVVESETVDFERLRFNGGENHIKLLSPVQERVTIEAQLKNSDYVMELFLATDALRRAGAKEISLLAPYIPYGRQDRVMVPGESLSIKVFAQLLNTQSYKAVYTLDNHSPVTTALIDRCIEIDNTRILDNFVSPINSVLISPDAGAYKKVVQIGRRFKLEVIQASKIRDVNTGEITGTKVDATYLDKKNYYIIDDICDGGRTFVELAKVLKRRGCDKIFLYVSHGIFSNGPRDLLADIDEIYVTNCFCRASQIPTGTIEVIPLRKEDLK